MNEITTRADMDFGKIDPEASRHIAVSPQLGGITFANALEVMDFAKLMAVADKAVPPHLRKNPGACLAVVMQAVEWRFSPFAVANKSYVVNDRIAYESQLLHAVVEARAPLAKRLEVEYQGEGPTRQCTITGTFLDDEVRTYTSPMVKDIKVKNSPLWVGDPDQQLFYFASRSWARRWVPDVLMGVYTKEELAANPRLGREDGGEGEVIEGTALHERLAAPRGDDHKAEGFKGNGHVDSELDALAPNRGPAVPEKQPDAGPPAGQEPPAQKTGTQQPPAGAATGEPPKGKKRAASKAKGDKPQTTEQPAAGEVAFEQDDDVTKCTTPAQYLKWWEARVASAKQAGISAEALLEMYAAQDELRTSLAVPISLRLKITDQMIPSVEA